MKSRLPLALLAVAVLAPVIHAQSEPGSLDPVKIKTSLENAAGLSNALKADRFNLYLMSDYLHLQYVVYLSDPECAPRETEELKALKADLTAIDALLFPSIDTSYEDLVDKASADFKKLYDKDQEIQTELKN